MLSWTRRPSALSTNGSNVDDPKMKLLDRQLCFAYLKAYLVCLVSLVGMFIVVDLFTNMDEFNRASDDFTGMTAYIGRYYLYYTAKIFDRLSEAIVLLAAMFTVAWMQRNNEFLPLLSAGVSARRVVLPVLICALGMALLSILNQELVLPRIDGFMIENRSNPEGENAIVASGAFEANGVFLSARVGYRQELKVVDFTVVIPSRLGGDGLTPLRAKEAKYIPAGAGRRTGGWQLFATTPPELENWQRDEVLEMIVPGQYFLPTTEVDFERITRGKNWHFYVTTWQLLQELDRTESNKAASLAVLFHMRLTRPVLGMVLVLMGLSVILRDQNRNLFLSAGLCLVLCGVFFAACFTCQSLGNYEYLSATLAAWLPVLVFGPLSWVMFDAVHT